MKTYLTFAMFTLLAEISTTSVLSATLTNCGVALPGVYFRLQSIPVPSVEPHETWLPTDKKLELVVSNGTVMPVYFIALRTRGFDLKAVSSHGVEVPKTEIAKALTRPPKSVTDFDANYSIVGRGHEGSYLSPNHTTTLAILPKVDDLFNFRQGGNYYLQLRLSVWDRLQKRFAQSGTLAVPIIREGKRSPGPPVAN